MASGEKLFQSREGCGEEDEAKWLEDSAVFTGKEEVKLPPLVKFYSHSPRQGLIIDLLRRKQGGICL